MLRTLTATTLFALSLTTAASAAPALDAGLNSRILEAAEKVCAPLLDSAHTTLIYKQWYAGCVTDSAARITARVAASRATSTALLTSQ